MEKITLFTQCDNDEANVIPIKFQYKLKVNANEISIPIKN